MQPQSRVEYGRLRLELLLGSKLKIVCFGARRNRPLLLSDVDRRQILPEGLTNEL